MFLHVLFSAFSEFGHQSIKTNLQTHIVSESEASGGRDYTVGRVLAESNDKQCSHCGLGGRKSIRPQKSPFNTPYYQQATG